jgi:hypothetical protein
MFEYYFGDQSMQFDKHIKYSQLYLEYEMIEGMLQILMKT